MSETDELYDKLQSMIGQVTGPYEANDEVNAPMIRHWCEAMQDGNPLYSDEEYAKNSKYGGIIAPPQMAQAYTVPRLWPSYEGREPNTLEILTELMDGSGFPYVVATTTSHEYHAPMKPGDKLSYTLEFSTASPQKTTGLGTGYFLTVVYTYKNQNDEVVCIQPFTIFKFKLNT